MVEPVRGPDGLAEGEVSGQDDVLSLQRDFLPSAWHGYRPTWVDISMFIGTICAYSLARFKTGGDNLANWIISQRMVPPIAVVFPIFLLYVWLGWVDTFTGVILLYTAFNLPYVIWMMRGYILDIPRALEESALVDGCTRWQVIWKVVFPMSRAGLFATAIFTFVFAWNEFLFALVLTRTEVATYTVQVTHYFGGQSNFWAKISAMSVLGTLPIFVAVAITVMNPEYMSVLWKDPRGHYLIGAAMIMQVTGMLIVRKILRIKI